MNMEDITLNGLRLRKTNLYVKSKSRHKQTKKKQAHRCREQISGSQRGGWRAKEMDERGQKV